MEPEKPPFRPAPIEDLSSSGLNPVTIESLILKFMLATGAASGRRIAQELGLPFMVLPETFRQLQTRKLTALSNALAINDFEYVLTDQGRARAASYMEECAYVGPAPVPFADYVAAVAAQTITAEMPKEADLRRAFSDLLVPRVLLDALGPAINSGQGLFLFGAPGNGKTSIAERITRCFGSTVWIPQVLEIEGHIVKLYDPACHETVVPERAGRFQVDVPDARWIEIRRPTILAGGELTMDNLEIRHDSVSRVSEAPFQLKSNNGTFLIDDFGRQKASPEDLLNRWIVPLEKRFDYLTLPNGKKVRAPFDQLIIFSTNLDPRRLVDEAFLRRIPYKIRMVDPTEDQFRQMFGILAPTFGFPPVEPGTLNYLIERHYKETRRSFRYCQPRDLLLQVRNHCIYNDLPLAVTCEHLDVAAENCFSGLNVDEEPRAARVTTRQRKLRLRSTA